MTEAERRYKQCGRKKRHMSGDAAIGAARDMQRKAHKSVLFCAFACKWCQGWHVGRESRNRPRYRAVG